MPSNSVASGDDPIIIEDKVNRIRKVLLEDYQTNNQSYDECDVQRVRDNDWTVLRFLKSNHMNEESALKSLTEAMQWRKTFGVNTTTDDYFPTDFYKIGGIFEYQTDKEGLPLLYFRVCVHHKVAELSEMIKQFFVHQVNKIDSRSDGQWAVVFDCSNGGLANVDMDFARFITQVMQCYFPKGYKYILIYEMPWIMAAFWKITRTWLSNEVKEQIKSATGLEIFDFIDAENVPQYIPGGKCQKSIHTIPEGVKAAELLPHITFTEEQMKRFRTIFNIKDEENGNSNNGDIH